MIIVQELSENDGNLKTVKVQLFADAKSEVTADANIIGLPTGKSIEMGSSVITAAGEVAFMKSDGTWNWV